MFKKMISLILAMVLISSVSMIVSAESSAIFLETIDQTESDVMPCYEYTNIAATSLSISTNGKATCSTSLNGYNGTTTKIVIKMTLQKDSWLWWSTEETWTATVNNWYADLTKTATVDSGTYRVKVEFTVYSGSKSEEITIYSQEKEY